MRDALILEENETILKTFEGGLELMGEDKSISGTLILTNQNIIFLKKDRHTIFSTPLEEINSVFRDASIISR